ncbi:MAG: 2-hydroxychromene-2-carboxylate isomerase [Candidatus Thiodiazotropha sp. (ex. Lucinisca nassula)]|nr:2-hydroxychromene-2-carboxylate isomerase [Candidatus Thiodiazotropha sp. (ex. Lucinisca nassula)]MBW9273371.1 2-hydroxychromene-2-carboxylate isomerase [Candidatus Thiodiazotropha sp. (ex. Lucinisca nassula)]PUB86158.1 MAG: disulfide bond formation protein DsbA [gamma proteobacterium symbiont of Ctena orbiculata]PUB89734.1 MAG: disulfide bond formation protein DsbA [gamma proteobacterium symbiont of Ctena orbiculata]
MNPDSADIYLYFNFRSPYCYLASKTMWRIFDGYRTNLIWRPLGGWDGRSPPDVAVKKLPIARQDMARFARRLGIPVNPPPKTTDPTLAGAGSLLAEEKGLLRPYIVEVMRKEWAEGQDIGVLDVLLDVGSEIGLDREALAEAAQDPARQAVLTHNWEEAEEKGAIGVPTFICEDEIFWGQDRIDFVLEYLRERRLSCL